MARPGTARKLVVTALLACACAYGEPARKALVIGNDNYRGHKLASAVRDAAAVSVTLRKLGFDVTTLNDLPNAGLKKAGLDFAATLKDDDIALVYFSGSGALFNGHAAMLGIDVNESGETVRALGSETRGLVRVQSDIDVGHVEVYDLVSTVRKATKGPAFFVFDMCLTSLAGGREMDQKLSTVSNAWIMFAAQPGQLAYEDADGGWLTKRMIGLLEQVGMTSESLGVRLTKLVVKDSQAKQVPFVNDQLDAPFTFQFAQDRGFATNPAAGAAISNADLIKGRKYALLIATSHYQDTNWRTLQNPLNDIRDIREELVRNYGYDASDVESVTDRTSAEIENKLIEYKKKTGVEEDSLFLYIAGHGVYDEDREAGYLAGTDSPLTTNDKQKYVAYQTIAKMTDSSKFKHVLVVLDSCYSGAFDFQRVESKVGVVLPSTLSPIEIVQRRAEHKSRLFITSGAKETVKDNYAPGADHSPFAALFLNELAQYGHGGIVRYEDLVSAVEGLSVSTPQHGFFLSSHPAGEFWFVPRQ